MALSLVAVTMDETRAEHQDEKRTKSLPETSPSRWHTRGSLYSFKHLGIGQSIDLKMYIEFYFYYVCFTIVVPYMFYVTYRLSTGTR